MRKFPLLVILLVFALSACASQSIEQGSVGPVTSTPTKHAQVEQPTEIMTEESPPVSVEQSSLPGNVTYKIIPGESQLQYEVGEVFLNQNNRINVAIGVTPEVSGEINVDLENPQNSSLGPITADISQFKSDSNRRDNAIRGRFIETARYPMVAFVANEIKGLPDSYQEGQELQLQIGGDLTIRETTQPVEFQTIVTLQDGTLKGYATTTILMSDFGFGPIDIAGILKTEDEALVTLNFVARP